VQALSRHVQQEEVIPRQVVVLLDAKRDPQRVASELERRLGVKLLRVAPLPALEAHLGLFLTQASVYETASRAEQVEGVLLAQPNKRYLTAAEAAAPPPEMQYSLKRIRADAAQRHASGKGVTVAVLDTGVDASHPALKGQVAASVDFTAPDIPGGAGEIHGTAVAALIAAKDALPAAAGGSMKGVAPGAQILAVKCCRQLAPNAPAAVCTSETIARGLDYAIGKAARVINLSLGGPEDRLVRLLVEGALGREILLVAAAGNRSERPSYPAALDGVLAVTATDLRDERYAEAAIGPHLTLAAPGVEVLSALAGKRYHFFTGTSMATAHVSGALALLLEVRPTLRPQDARTLLETTAVDLGQPGRDFLFGHGRLDACRAIEDMMGKNFCL
jgi:subtilisin family serine protease